MHVSKFQAREPGDPVGIRQVTTKGSVKVNGSVPENRKTENQIAKFRDTFWSLKGADDASYFFRGAQIPMYSTVFDWTNTAPLHSIIVWTNKFQA